MATHKTRPVLVVDDVTMMRTITRHLLRETGFQQIDEVADGESALAAIGRKDYGLILCDEDLARMSCRELLKRLQAGEDSRHVPVLILTSGTPHGARDMAPSLAKPFTAEALERSIERLFIEA